MINKRGITLIALIITIIILLILTGITISAIMGDNGIISQAVNSKANTSKAAAKEQLEMAWSARMTKFLEEKNRPINRSYLNEILIDLNDNLGSSKGKVQGIKYNTVSNNYVVIYESDDNKYYTFEITKAGEMSIIREETSKDVIIEELANDYAVTEDIQSKLANPEVFSYEIMSSSLHTADIVGLVDDTVTEVVCPSKVKLNSSGELDSNGEEYTLTRLRGQSFKDNTSITKVTFLPGITDISGNAFMGATSLKTVIMSDTIKCVQDGAFNGCTGLEYVEFSNNLENISHYAFYGCSSLNNVVLPESLLTIGMNAFRECSSLTSITIPKNVSIVYSSAFSSCSSLTEVVFLNSLTSIEASTFAECEALTRVVLPNNLEKIGSYSFANCSSLESIILPSTLISIEEGAFVTCSNLSIIYFRGTEAQWNNVTINNNHNYHNRIINIEKQYNYTGN